MTQEISKQIEQQAKEYAQTKCADFEGKKGIHRKTILMYAHQAGATEWAGKAQGLVDALESIGGICPGDTENATLSNILLARTIAANALAKYKEGVK